VSQHGPTSWKASDRTLVAGGIHYEEAEDQEENEDAEKVDVEGDAHVHVLVCIVLVLGPGHLTDNPSNGKPKAEDGEEECYCATSSQADRSPEMPDQSHKASNGATNEKRLLDCSMHKDLHFRRRDPGRANLVRKLLPLWHVLLGELGEDYQTHHGSAGEVGKELQEDRRIVVESGSPSQDTLDEASARKQTLACLITTEQEQHVCSHDGHHERSYVPAISKVVVDAIDTGILDANRQWSTFVTTIFSQLSVPLS